MPPLAGRFLDGVRDRIYDGHLEASTAVALVGVLRDLMSPNPVETFSNSTGRIGTPAKLVESIVDALTRAIEELTRPIDAIKHQAKTVTVGISRSDEGIIDRLLVQATFAGGCWPRRAQLSHAEDPRRSQPGDRRSHRIHPVQHRGRVDLDRRSWRHLDQRQEPR